MENQPIRGPPARRSNVLATITDEIMEETEVAAPAGAGAHGVTVHVPTISTATSSQSAQTGSARGHQTVTAEVHTRTMASMDRHVQRMRRNLQEPPPIQAQQQPQIDMTDRRARDLEKKRTRRRNMTEEQRERERQRQREYRQNRTDEQRAARAEQERQRVQTRTEEQRAEIAEQTAEQRTQRAERDRQRRQDRTPEQRAERADRDRQRRQERTPEQRAQIAERDRQRRQEQTAEQRAQQAERDRQRRQERTAEQRAQQAERDHQRRQERTPEQRAQQAERDHQRRQERTPEQRAQQAERDRQRRQERTPEQRAQQAERDRQRRQERTAEERAERANRDRQQRQERTAEQRAIDIEQNRERQARRQIRARYRGVTLTPQNLELTVQTLNIGGRDYICAGCGAMMFKGEAHKGKLGVNATFSLCCGSGSIRLESVRPPPDTVQHLYTDNTPVAKDFRANVRKYNSALALASVGVDLGAVFQFQGGGPWVYRLNGQIYHSLGTLYPGPDRQPVFSQLYIYDTDNELANRMRRNPDMHQHTLQLLQQAMHDHNPYVRDYKRVAEVVADNPTADVRLVLKAKGTPDRRRYNLPTGNDIAVVIPQVGDAAPDPKSRDVVLFKRPGDHPAGNSTVRINELHPMYDPTAYPLLFINGDLGYDFEEKILENGTKISGRKYYRYRFMERANDFNVLHRSGRLFQQYITDAWCKIERQDLEYIRNNQPRLRAELYQGVADALTVRAQQGGNEQIGTRVILPSTHTGSARNMHELYQDAMALVRRYGKPELFITFTCNPRWTEISDVLTPGQTTTDRQDIVNRVFRLKLAEFFKDLFTHEVLGEVKAYVWTLEEQKRSLKHVHLLAIMQQNVNPDWIDTIVCAYIPDKNINPRLHRIVTDSMLHGPCGTINPNSPCMVDGRCRSGYPKSYQEETALNRDGYSIYRRPDDGTTHTKHNFTYDNRWVVPYNPFLLLKYDAHINVEVCGSVKNVKYLYKYITKGPDMASVALADTERNNEITRHVISRWITASTGIWNVLEFPTHGRYPPILRLAVHEANLQTVTFFQGEEEEALDRNAETTLTAWFAYNRDHPEARQYRYYQFPEHFRWAASTKSWVPRKNQLFSVARVYATNPSQGERHYLRILLHHVSGATCYEDLRTLPDGTVLETFKETAVALGLLTDDAESHNCLNEAVVSAMPVQMRRLFAIILVYCEPTLPLNLWDMFKESMGDDIRHRFTRDGLLLITPEQIDNEVLLALDATLTSMGSSLAAFKTLPQPVAAAAVGGVDRVVMEEMFDQAMQQNIFDETRPSLNPTQSRIIDAIMAAVDDDTITDRLFVVNAPGGCGKTFMFAALLSGVRARGHIALAVASTGLAAENLPGGRTAHSRFKIPIPIFDDSVCSIKGQSSLADLIRRTRVVVWDEVMASHRHAVECVDRSLKEIRESDEPFGGCVVVFGGDTRQLLPVVRHGGEAQITNSCLKFSPLWSSFAQHELTQNMRVDPDEVTFSKFLLTIGHGEHTVMEGDLPHRMVVPPTFLAPNLDALIDFVFPGLSDGYEDQYFMSHRSILTPYNEDVDKINEICVDRFPGEPKTYFSADRLDDDSADMNIPIEYINSLTPSGMPPHKLTIKPNSVIMLLRNLQAGPKEGLRNGTRLLATSLGNRVIECEVLTGTCRGTTVFLPRIPLILRDSDFPFVMIRKQFPVRLCFGMSIHKSQGQTLDRVGLYIPRPVFSHGQLYVAFSRVRNEMSIKLSLGEGDDGRTSNIIYPAVL